ncbi:MAG TPA: hypothetical protein V6C65_26430, partial [Allocoleopsis sp.]
SGTIAEDANFMTGRWQIGRSASGRWEAHRSNTDLMVDLKNRLAQQQPVGAGSVSNRLQDPFSVKIEQ